MICNLKEMSSQFGSLTERFRNSETAIGDLKRQFCNSSQRKSLIGSGDRSERIRTYNFPQGRVTDHRINLTIYKLDQVLDGFLDEFSNNLVAEHQANLLSEID